MDTTLYLHSISSAASGGNINPVWMGAKERHLIRDARSRTNHSE